jgi:hypothetical protein
VAEYGVEEGGGVAEGGEFHQEANDGDLFAWSFVSTLRRSLIRGMKAGAGAYSQSQKQSGTP